MSTEGYYTPVSADEDGQISQLPQQTTAKQSSRWRYCLPSLLLLCVSVLLLITGAAICHWASVVIPLSFDMSGAYHSTAYSVCAQLHFARRWHVVELFCYLHVVSVL